MTNDRRSLMKEYIREHIHVRVRDLEEKFPDVSVMTIRRDLAALEEEGFIIRTRGGARINGLRTGGAAEDFYSSREQSNLEAKIAISEKALAFLETKRSIFLDAGTTLMTMVHRMPDQEYVLFTTAPNIAMEIYQHTGKPQVTLLGGALSRTSFSSSGQATLDHLRSINIDLAFMSTSGFSYSDGFTAGNPYEAEFKKQVIQKTRRVVMLMTTDKIDRNLPYTFAQMNEIDVLICEKKPEDDFARCVTENGVILL